MTGHEKIHRVQRVWLVVTVIAATAALTFGGIAVYRRATTWNPLGEWPVQRLTNELPLGSTTPTVRVGDVVMVDGTKCNASDGPVDIKGGLHWETVEPPGFRTAYSLGQNRILPGCTRSTHANPMPVEVVAWVNRLCREHRRCSTVWRLAGYAVPVDTDGDEGSQRLWITSNFTILAEDAT